LPGFAQQHPYETLTHQQGVLACLFELQNMLGHVTGMAGVSLSPAAGAQGEWAGMAMIRAYHHARKDLARTEVLIPDAAHGTNPATAVMCGFHVREIPTNEEGDVDLAALKKAVGPKTAAVMLTNPSTVGVFERRIKEIAETVHEAGGLLYYDGANLNAILGKVRPGEMGFDAIHMNLHKTFATPHGGGGPGAGAVGVSSRLIPFLPVPRVEQDSQTGRYGWLTDKSSPQTIGQLSAFSGNIGILLRAYVYCRLLGAEGLVRVAEFATLNANYLMHKLVEAGFTVPYPQRRASHEFVVTLKNEAKAFGLTAGVVAKNLLDEGIHAPTTYFPLLIPECLLIEPTETETKETLDHFVDIMVQLRDRAAQGDERIATAPHTMPVKKLDEVKAARELNLVWVDEGDALTEQA
jgi:glycine dehydrogenase subunit 2